MTKNEIRKIIAKQRNRLEMSMQKMSAIEAEIEMTRITIAFLESELDKAV